MKAYATGAFTRRITPTLMRPVINRSRTTSDLTLLKRWVQAFQLDARVGGCKAPVGFGVVVIAARAPCSDLVDKGGAEFQREVQRLKQI